MDMLNRTDSTMLTLLSDKLQSRLGGCLIDFDDLEIDTKLGKGTHNFRSMSYRHPSDENDVLLNSCMGNYLTFYLQDIRQLFFR